MRSALGNIGVVAFLGAALVKGQDPARPCEAGIFARILTGTIGNVTGRIDSGPAQAPVTYGDLYVNTSQHFYTLDLGPFT